MAEIQLLKFSFGERRLIARYGRDPGRFTRCKLVTVRGKKRCIVTYADSREGIALRRLHVRVHRYLTEVAPRSGASYAYRRGVSALDCVRAHLNATLFFKTDVHKFFESADPAVMYRLLMLLCMGREQESDLFGADRIRAPRRLRKRAKQMIRACFYRGGLAIGFVCSPALSDLYLYLVDRRMEACGVTYTRYADDVLLSGSGRRDRQPLADAGALLERCLKQLGLQLNRRKTFTRELKAEGDALHFLGVNLVRRADRALEVTVGDRYIRQTCLLAAKLDGGGTPRERLILVGREQFIRRVSGKCYEKYLRLCRIKRVAGDPAAAAAAII